MIGGRHGSDDLAAVSRELVHAGFGRSEESDGFMSMVPGPLLRGTDGHHVSHMPLDPSSTYGALHKIYDEAYELANAQSADPWLDLQGLSEPLWGHHSNRRGADSLARQSMDRTGVTEEDIDLTFGWQERMYNRKMQFHYSARFNREKRYRVTMYF